LLYDQYNDYLIRKEIPLKDAFVFSIMSQEKIEVITFDDGLSRNSEKIISNMN